MSLFYGMILISVAFIFHAAFTFYLMSRLNKKLEIIHARSEQRVHDARMDLEGYKDLSSGPRYREYGDLS